MSDRSYSVEFAKTSRSKCKKCKDFIQKGEIRISVTVPGESFDTVSQYHPACFALPKSLSMGAGKIATEDFVQEMLEDKTGGEILPVKAMEIIAAIDSKPVKKKDESPSYLNSLKRAYEASMEEEENPSKKKLKKEHDPRIAIYGKYHKYKIDDLKDILRWNRQTMTGTRDILLAKVIDGECNGRLARCALCGSRLKLSPDGENVTCNGGFMECAFQTTVEKAPRWHPWFTHEPNEEETAELDRLDAEAKGEQGPAAEADLAKLSKAAAELPWDLSNRDGMRAAAESMLKLLSTDNGDKKVSLPEDPVAAKQKIGHLIAMNKDKTAGDMIAVIVEALGFSEDRKERASKKEAAIEALVKNPKNARLVAAFQELAELYFKEKNRNAGASYTKVANAIKDISFQITEENAMGLSKGKTKVPNIGKSSAEKILEFCQTGTIEKLEQKRAEAA